MRLSGNYFERLLINVLPWTLLVSGLIFMAKGNLDGTIATFIILTCTFWLLDTLVIFFKFKNPKSLRSSTNLVWGKQLISADDVVEVIPILDKRFRWSFRMVQFRLKDGGEFMIIDKPQTIVGDLMNKQSRTVKRLIERHAELKSKVAALKSI